MLTLSKTRPQRGSVCHRCQVIRLFLVVAVGLAIFAIVTDDALQNLDSVTPIWPAIGICLLGFLGFVIKVIAWKAGVASEQLPPSFNPAAPVSNDHAQGEPPSAWSEKTGHMSSR